MEETTFDKELITVNLTVIWLNGVKHDYDDQINMININIYKQHYIHTPNI